MPDIKSIVKQMIEDGESEDVIDAVVKKMQGGSEIKSGLPDMSPPAPDKDEYKGPDTFWGGVKKSLTGEEFDTTARKSLKGFAKGTADLGATFADTAQGFASGVHSLIQDPAAHFRAMGPAFKEMGQGMWDITKNAGADPEAFGHLSGQLFGQPAFTEGIIKAPAIAKATTGAINRIPAVNKTFSSVGKALEGTRDPKILPASSRGLVAGAVRGVARPVGRALSRVGERGRLDAGTRPPNSKTNIKLKGETETPHSPDSDIFAGGGQGAVRPRPVRTTPANLVDQNSEFTRPILESAEELAARKRPSLFTGGQSRRNQSTPFEPRPVDTTPYPVPGEIPAGIPSEAPLVRDTTPYEPPPTRPPGIPPERPITPTPDPIPVGEGGLSSRYQHRPYEPGQQAAAIAENAGKPKTAASPIDTPFEPSVDPAKNFSFEDLQMMKSRRDEVNAILRKMAEENVDPTTGEIFPFQETFPGLEQPPKRARNWSITSDEGAKFVDNVNEEMGYAGGDRSVDFANDIGLPETSRRFPGDEAFDLGEISPGFRETSSMPNWGPSEVLDAPDLTSPVGRLNNEQLTRLSKLSPAEGGTGERGNAAQIELMRRGIGEGAPHVNDSTFYNARNGEIINHNFRQGTSNTTRLEPGPVNPLRPEVPPGQITNRRMFELSKQRAAEMRAAETQQFNDSIGHEFDQDMMFAPEELGQPDVPKFTSPFENQFDQRISGIDQPRTIQPEEWGDWGGLEADIPTLVPDASGSHVAAPGRKFAQEVEAGVPFDDANPDFSDPFIRDTERLDRALKNRPFDQGRADSGAQWNREQQRSALYEGRNINDIKTPPTAKQLQVQAANDKVRQFSDEHSRRFSEIEEQLPEGEIYTEPPDQKAAFDAEYQRLQEERNALVESLYPNEVRALKDPLPDIDAQAVQPRKQLSQFSAKANEEAGSFNVDNDLGTANDSSRLVNGKGSSRHPTAERWEGIVKELEARNAPDSEYRDILSTGSKDDLKKGQTWKSKVQDGIKYYDEVNKKKVKTEPKAELIDQRVTDPNGKHLGDIVITEKRIKALQEHPVFKDMTREQVIEQLHGAQLETILAKAKVPENARTRVKVEPIDYNTNKTIPQELPADSGMYKIESQEGVEFPNDTLAAPIGRPKLDIGGGRAGSDVGDFGAESLTDFSGTTGPPVKTKPSAFKTSTKVTIDPDVDFGPGGDIKPIIQEARRLNSDQAVDSKYRSLLPKIMRSELAPGETYKGKLDRLITEIQGELGPEQGAQRLAEMDAFNESLKRSTGAEPPSEIPLLPKFGKMDLGALSKGKLDKRPEPWISPRIQQQFPDLARKLRDLNRKK